MNDWQLIETAPKDGQQIKLPNGVIAHWVSLCGRLGYWQTTKPTPFEGLEPTHWMPLSDPPAALETKPARQTKLQP